MAHAWDKEPDEICVGLNISVTENLRQLIEEDAKKYCGGQIAMWGRHIIRSYYGLKTYVHVKDEK